MASITIASFNMNRGMRTPVRCGRFHAWLASHQPAVVLLQEPWSADVPACDIPEYEPLFRSSLVACYAREALYRECAPSAAQGHERWVHVSLGDTHIHNVYLDDKSSRARAALLNLLAARLDPAKSHCIVGDFNMAPRDVDGQYGGQRSTWTKNYERAALDALLHAGRLVDLFVARSAGQQEFTFERRNRGRLTQFRCDLALVDQHFAEQSACCLRYVHEARSGAHAFTDHSGVLVTVDP